MRGELSILICSVKKIIEAEAIDLNSLKFFLILIPEFQGKVEAAKSIEDAMIVVCNYTSLINTSYLQAVAKNFNLQDAIDLIKKFDDSIGEFCKTILAEHIYGQDFMYSRKHLYKSEEVEFILEWKGDETTLSDIRNLLEKAFYDKAIHVIVKVVNPSNSMIVTCYAPPHLHEELMIVVKHNEVYLRKMNVLSITIGGEIVLKREMKDQVRF